MEGFGVLVLAGTMVLLLVAGLWQGPRRQATEPPLPQERFLQLVCDHLGVDRKGFRQEQYAFEGA